MYEAILKFQTDQVVVLNVRLDYIHHFKKNRDEHKMFCRTRNWYWKNCDIDTILKYKINQAQLAE